MLKVPFDVLYICNLLRWSIAAHQILGRAPETWTFGLDIPPGVSTGERKFGLAGDDVRYINSQDSGHFSCTYKFADLAIRLVALGRVTASEVTGENRTPQHVLNRSLKTTDSTEEGVDAGTR